MRRKLIVEVGDLVPSVQPSDIEVAPIRLSKPLATGTRSGMRRPLPANAILRFDQPLSPDQFDEWANTKLRFCTISWEDEKGRSGSARARILSVGGAPEGQAWVKVVGDPDGLGQLR